MAKKKAENNIEEDKTIPKTRGLPPGRTNNPNGRPKGAKNKVQLATKERIAEYVEGDFDNFVKEIKKLPIKDRVRAKIELIKLVVPRPLADEEKEAISTQSVLFKRLSQPND